MKSAHWSDRFFAGLYGQVLAGAFDERTNLRQARLVRRLLELRKGQHLLDCPCGQGRLSVPLAAMGLKVTGVDITPSYVRAARARAAKAGVKARFIRQDMRQIEFNRCFDAVLNWFTSFGYFSDAQNLEFCRRARKALRPSGQFLIEAINKTWVLEHFQPGHDEVIAGVRIVSRCRYNARTSRIHNVWKLSKDLRRETLRFDLRIYSAPELRSLLRRAGFARVQLFSHTRGRVGRLTRHAPRLIAVAK